jgi:thymidylate synthase
MTDTFNNADEAYHAAVRQVLSDGTRKPNRTGVDTLSYFGLNYSINMLEGFPLLTTKAIQWHHIVVEMLWFLSGRTDISILHQHGIKFWDAWANADGEVPSAYGNFWRSFPVRGEIYWGANNDGLGPLFLKESNDQITWIIDEIKKNPMSRRLVVSAWEPSNAQTSKLPPCHLLFAFNVQNTVNGDQLLNLHLTQRSADMALGVPYNIASYGLLLHLIARFTGLKPGNFSHTLVDAHVYTCKSNGDQADHDHVPNLEIQLKRMPRPAPKLVLSDDIQALGDIEALIQNPDLDYILSHIRLDNYEPHDALKFKVAV